MNHIVDDLAILCQLGVSLLALNKLLTILNEAAKLLMLVLDVTYQLLVPEKLQFSLIIFDLLVLPEHFLEFFALLTCLLCIFLEYVLALFELLFKLKVENVLQFVAHGYLKLSSLESFERLNLFQHVFPANVLNLVVLVQNISSDRIKYLCQLYKLVHEFFVVLLFVPEQLSSALL